MGDLLSEFENSLNNFFINRNYKVSFRRCTHECERCDYSVFITSFSSEECFGKTVLSVIEPATNSPLVSDLMEESKSWKFKVKDIQTSNNYIYIYLNKEDVFYNCFNEVLKCCTEYGTSSVFQDKVFLLTNDLMNNPPLTLTELRVKLSAAILKKVLTAGGTIVTENSCSEKIYKQIHISHKSFKKSSETMGHEAFKFFLVAPVSKDGHVSPTCYKKKIKENLLENEVNSSRSDEELDTLVDAVILFDLFKSKLSKNVKLTDHLNADRGAIFSIYNYARLRLILDTFEEKCSSGIYPKLPQLEDLDFSLLMDEDEWRLVFDYVLAWPSVLSVVLKGLDEYDDCNHDCKIHLLVNFMQTLSFSVSSYYSRIQILREPRPQLLLYLFARIYLLKAVVRVMDNCFSILGIQPLSRM